MIFKDHDYDALIKVEHSTPEEMEYRIKLFTDLGWGVVTTVTSSYQTDFTILGCLKGRFPLKVPKLS